MTKRATLLESYAAVNKVISRRYIPSIVEVPAEKEARNIDLLEFKVGLSRFRKFLPN